MILDDQDTTLYDVLEVGPDASPQEVREAYLRLKSAYSRDSVALYTLVSREETEGMLRRIEQAYHVLSNPEKRKEYDRNHHLLSAEQEIPDTAFHFGHGQKIISIDRVPPMEDTGDEGDPLVAPPTDFTQDSHRARARANAAPSVPSAAPEGPLRAPVQPQAPSTPAVATPGLVRESAPAMQPSAPAAATVTVMEDAGARAELTRLLETETDWRGASIRKIRELQGISLEELSEYTKITKKYLRAIEDEDFSTLPAPVYLRGFVVQVAKKLRMPHERVATAYLARYRSSLPDRD
jgi:hypothetical protein